MTAELSHADAETLPHIIGLPSRDNILRARLPDGANESEAAAIAAAVVAYLDEERETPAAAELDPVCPWTVAGRIELATGKRPQCQRDLPGDCHRGEEWAYAGRCR